MLEASPAVVSWLARHELLFEQSEHVHDYPHCWRCDRPLIYRAVGSWFVRVSAIKQALLAHNRQITWVPEHIRDGRFGQWLEHARDWAISRNRFWGSPIPVWRCGACAKADVIGSVDELEKRAGRPVPDLHRPYIDEVSFPCDRCGADMARVPEVLDCWFESGSMPFAQVHYPFERDSVDLKTTALEDALAASTVTLDAGTAHVAIGRFSVPSILLRLRSNVPSGR